MLCEHSPLQGKRRVFVRSAIARMSATMIRSGVKNGRCTFNENRGAPRNVEKLAYGFLDSSWQLFCKKPKLFPKLELAVSVARATPFQVRHRPTQVLLLDTNTTLIRAEKRCTARAESDVFSPEFHTVSIY